MEKYESDTDEEKTTKKGVTQIPYAKNKEKKKKEVVQLTSDTDLDPDLDKTKRSELKKDQRRNAAGPDSYFEDDDTLNKTDQKASKRTTKVPKKYESDTDEEEKTTKKGVTQVPYAKNKEKKKKEVVQLTSDTDSDLDLDKTKRSKLKKDQRRNAAGPDSYFEDDDTLNKTDQKASKRTTMQRSPKS